MLFLITLTLMQGHSGSAKAKNQCGMLSATKQTIRIKLATTVGDFLSDLDFAMFIWLDQLVKNVIKPTPLEQSFYHFFLSKFCLCVWKW